MNKLKGILTKRYAIYHLRWQISALVMMPIMLFLEAHLPLWGNLMVGQFVGAMIFYGVDTYIFKEHKEDNIEAALVTEVCDRKI